MLRIIRIEEESACPNSPQGDLPSDYFDPPGHQPEGLRELIRQKQVLFEISEKIGEFRQTAAIDCPRHLSEVDALAHDVYSGLGLRTPPPRFGAIASYSDGIAALRQYEIWLCNAAEGWRPPAGDNDPPQGESPPPAKLSPCHTLALREYSAAIRLSQDTDRKLSEGETPARVWEWLNEDVPGRERPNAIRRETWCRYVREGRRVAGD